MISLFQLCVVSTDYTYGNDYDEAGRMMYGKGVSKYYHWDKRDYTFEYPPGNFALPPPDVMLSHLHTIDFWYSCLHSGLKGCANDGSFDTCLCCAGSG